MKRVSMLRSLFVTLAVASLPAVLRAQSDNLLVTEKTNPSIGSLNGGSEETETQSGKNLVPENQPGNLLASAQVALKPWNALSMRADTRRPNWRIWTFARLGSVLSGPAIPPYAAPGAAAIKPWIALGIPIGAPSPGRESWTFARPGALPLALAVQPDAAQRYGADPSILQIYFGHRR